MHLLLPLALTILNSTDVSYTEALCAPAVVHQCDVIVEATVIGTGIVESANVHLPRLDTSGFPKDPATRRAEQIPMTKHRATIDAVYFDRTESLKVGEEIGFATPHEIVRQSHPSLTRAQGLVNHHLKPGQYLLLLRRFARDDAGYYLPYNRHCAISRERISAHFGANFKEVLDPNQWNWSAPDQRGLQIAAVVRSPVERTPTNSIDFQVALRQNTSTNLSLLLHPGLRPVRIEISDEAGEPTSIQPDLYAGMKSLDPRAVVPYTLKPGQVLFVQEGGPALQWSSAPPALEPGRYTLKTSYQIPVTNIIPEIYWRGSIQSPPAVFEIVPDRRKASPAAKP